MVQAEIASCIDFVFVCTSPGNKVMDYYGIPRWRISLGFGKHDYLRLVFQCFWTVNYYKFICQRITNLEKVDIIHSQCIQKKKSKQLN